MLVWQLPVCWFTSYCTVTLRVNYARDGLICAGVKLHAGGDEKHDSTE